MNATAPQFDTMLLTRQNMLFLTLAVLLHLFVLYGLDRDVMPDKPRLQENPIAVQLRDIPEQTEQKNVSPAPKPGPQAAPEAKPPAAVKKTVAPLISPEPEPALAPEPAPVVPVEVKDNTPVPAAETKPEVKAEEASGTPGQDSSNTEGPQTYPVRAPQTGTISMRIVRTEPNRSPVYGDGEINWEFKTGRYKMSINATLDLLLTSINLYQMHSEGLIDTYGITPATSSEKRRNRSETATHFDHQKKSVSFSSSNKTAEIKDGAQDKASFLMQLAGIGYADPEKFQTGREIRLQVAEERDVTTFVFIVTAYEEVETKAGKFMAWHIVRPPLPGSYNSKLEVWLSPDQHWYPVQIRNTESNGAVTTQTATKIISITNMER
ncbi:DUF3108 domain-containing protein [Undibacterium sp. Tian12W]|uniref:DUF3108 domain-containing protein n=1 Tax=Undibacterium sp. Tian12W TaxID=3413054 RepID=UPI003BF3939D